jgi:ABC-type oligopeptide transport system substrate-binding subunit
MFERSRQPRSALCQIAVAQPEPQQRSSEQQRGCGISWFPQSPVERSAHVKDDAYTRLVNQILAVADPASQKLLYAQLNDYWLDQSWVLPVTQNPPRVAARANVRGLRYDAHEALVLSDVWLA